MRFAAIKPKCHLVQVGLEVLRADLVPSSNNAAFQKRERRLCGICVDITVNVNLVLVFNRFVLSAMHASFNHGLRVSSPLVRNDHVHICADVFFDVVRQCAALNIVSMEESQIAATLTNTDNNLFTLSAKFAGTFSADKCLVHLDGSREHRFLNFGHRLADSVAEIPCRLVGDAEGALDLVCADSFACLTEQQNHQKPCLQRQMRVVKNSVTENAELIFTVSAFMLLLCVYVRYGCALTSWAFDTHRPPKPLKEFPATGIIRVKIVEVN